MRRRRARVVLWGGRPNLDIQIGSAADRIRQRRLRRKAAIDRMTRSLMEAGANMARAVTEAVETIRRSGLGDTARRLRAQDEDQRRMDELDRRREDPPGHFQTRPPRITALKMDAGDAAKTFLVGKRVGPPASDPPAPARRFYHVEGSLDPPFREEWPIDEGEQLMRWISGDDTAITDAQKYSPTIQAEGEIAFEVDPAAFGKFLDGYTRTFAINMGLIPPDSPGGCRHPASALGPMDFGHVPGWVRCADCNTPIAPHHIGASA